MPLNTTNILEDICHPGTPRHAGRHARLWHYWRKLLVPLLNYKIKMTPYQTQMEWPRWLSYVTCTSHLLTTLNCSGDDHSDDDDVDDEKNNVPVNFYIYFLKHRHHLNCQRRDRSNVVDLPTLWTSTGHGHTVSRAANQGLRRRSSLRSSPG